MEFKDKQIAYNCDMVMNCAEHDTDFMQPWLDEALERAYKEGRDQGHKDIQDKVNDFLHR